MAVDVTEIFQHYRDCFDEETWALIAGGGKDGHRRDAAGM
jgi:hypothetical protein